MTYVRYVYFGPSVVYFPATFFQTALILISGKDGVMDLIYGGYSSDDAHISGITNDTLNLDSH
jgi:hypothetical protein